MANDLREFNARRDALFRDMTVEHATAYWEWARFEAPLGPFDPLAMAHRARLQWLDATDAMLAESKQWLQDNGYAAQMRGARPLDPLTRDFDRARLGKPSLRERRRR